MTTARAPATAGRPRLHAVEVVVPAHDEEERVRDCLVSVARSAEAMASRRPSVTVAITLVLDRCTDGTADVARSLGVPTLAVEAGSVGAARRAGVAWATQGHRSPDGVLVVNTDADCRVPTGWLGDLVELATDVDVVLGEVEPDPLETAPALLEAWWERHPRGRGSLHGANLAVRLDAYLRAGGFPAVAEKEDVLLVRALRASGAAVTGGTRVLTSGRLAGRAPGGFAGYLRGLDDELRSGSVQETAPSSVAAAALLDAGQQLLRDVHEPPTRRPGP